MADMGDAERNHIAKWDKDMNENRSHATDSAAQSPSSGRKRSTSSPASPERSDRPVLKNASSPSEDSLITPRPESHQADRLAQHGSRFGTSMDHGYFSPNATTNQSVDLLTIRQNSHAQPILPSLSAVSVSAPVPPAVELNSSTSTLEHLKDRSVALGDDESQRSTTLQSDTQTSTGTRPLPVRSLTEYPIYPDQSFKALQRQVYPKPHPPPYISRPQPSLHPFSTSTSRLPAVPGHLVLTQEPGSKTVGSSPAHTPGLFSPNSARQNYSNELEDFSDRSPYPSPYLHPVQPHPPRETHKAEKDVDTFSGRKKINQYEILEELGRGVHGKVKLARSLETGDYVAIKIVQRYPKKHRLGKADAPEDKVKREVAILKKASHQNVVSMLEVIDDPTYSKIYIVLEFCELREVDWRTLGDSAIVYLEEVRQDRIAQGVGSPTVTDHEHRLLRSANRKEKRRRRAKWRESQRPDGSLEFWSLEFAGESEEESSEGISRTSSAVTDLQSPIAGLAELPEDDLLEVPASSADDEAATPVPSDHSVATSRQIPPHHSWDYLDVHAQSFGHAVSTANAGPVELNTVINSVSRGRRASVAASLSSQITEAVEEEVLEEHRYVPVMTIPESRAAFRDAVLGLEYLHYQGIVHRDIKPANLLRTRDHRVKISDFGVSYLGKPMREGRDSEDVSESESQDLDEEIELAKTVGTPAFYAPELCSLDITSETVVTGQIDVWALGVTLYCLLFARTPFTADNTFALMRRIAKTDVLIPRQRLKAVENRPSSRSSSRGPVFRTNPIDKRLPNEIAYEDIDDDLHDLLKRLLIKDPKARITIKEIKHHPWVLADISNKTAWIEETDPSRHTQGKKIEISNKEVAEAVVPLKLVDRVRSVARKVGGAIGLGGSRKESRATAAHPASPASLQDVKDGRRHSMRVDESIYSALVASRGPEGEPEPLDGSKNPPGGHLDPQQVSDPPSTTSSPRLVATGSSSPATRPTMPDRVNSKVSTAASIRTVKQEDIDRGRDTPPSPVQPESSTPHGAATLGGLLNGAGQRLIRSMRSRDRGSRNRDISLSSPARDAHDHFDDVHGDPSVAVSVPYVAGVVGRGIDRSPADSARVSPNQSPAPSTNPSSDHLYLPLTSTPPRQHSPAGTSTSRIRNVVIQSLGGGLSRDAAPYSPRSDPPSEEEIFQVREMLNRRRLLEDERSNPSSNNSRPTSSRVCPPSPDDDIYNEKQLTADTQSAIQTKDVTTGTDASHALAPTDVRAVSSSSEDRFASAASQSTFPSMQSMLSADTSVLPEHSSTNLHKEDSTDSSDTANPGSRLTPLPAQSESGTGLSPTTKHSSSGFLSRSEDEGYVGDNAVETDEDVADSDSDSDGDFIVMSRHKVAAGSGLLKSSTGSDDGFSSDNSRLKTPSKKSARSGSSNTVKEIRHDEVEDSKEKLQPVEGE